jgi:hypothetical protein
MENQEEVYNSQKSIAHYLRESIHKLFDRWNNIDRLMSDKVEDMILIEEIPLSIKLGDKTILVGNLNWDNENKFFRDWAKILSLILAKKYNFEIGMDLLQDSLKLKQVLNTHTKIKRKLKNLICNTVLKQQQFYYDILKDKIKVIKWKPCSFRYFKKWVSTEIIMQICKAIHLYNFDAVKKNLSILAGSLGLHQHVENYMYHWLRNSGGLMGKFVAAQAPSIDYAFRDLPKEEPKASPKENEVKDK